MHTFLEAKKQLDDKAITNIIALGDNQIELDAAYNLASQYENAFIKTIKFREGPSPQELTKQIRLVYQQFDQICLAAKNLTVKLQRYSEEIDENENNQQNPKASGVQNGATSGLR